jgi:hypothetical protein
MTHETDELSPAKGFAPHTGYDPLDGAEPGVTLSKGNPCAGMVAGVSNQLTAYVLMGNDFPEAVFLDKAAADAGLAEAKRDRKRVDKYYRIYWRLYEFTVDRPREAAAPELLEALERLWRICANSEGVTALEYAEVMEAADAAIAKAKGGAS